jgi:hypothetical protein
MSPMKDRLYRWPTLVGAIIVVQVLGAGLKWR